MGRTKITHKEYQKFPRGESNHGYHAKPSYNHYHMIEKQNIKPRVVKESKLISKINKKRFKL